MEKQKNEILKKRSFENSKMKNLPVRQLREGRHTPGRKQKPRSTIGHTAPCCRVRADGWLLSHDGGSDALNAVTGGRQLKADSPKKTTQISNTRVLETTKKQNSKI